MNWLCLLIINEIHLVDQWKKIFRPLYAEIEKFQMRILYNISPLDISATLTKQAQIKILDKTGFKSSYCSI